MNAETPPLTGTWFEQAAVGLPEALLDGMGRAFVVDLDGDGLDDLVLTRVQDEDYGVDPLGKTVLLGRGDGTFVDHTERSGLAGAMGQTFLFADVDNDGDQDVWVGPGLAPNQGGFGIWLNNGEGVFRPNVGSGVVPAVARSGAEDFDAIEDGAAFFDGNGDGVLDLYVANREHGGLGPVGVVIPSADDQLFRGVGDGSFVDVSDTLPVQTTDRAYGSEAQGRPATSVAVGDVDDDGDQDLFVGNFALSRLNDGVLPNGDCQPPWDGMDNWLWRNDGDMILVDVGVEAGVHATVRGQDGVQVEDIVDLGSECPPETQGRFERELGGATRTASFADFDHDGDLDLLVGASVQDDMVRLDPTLLMVNQGDGTFVDEAFDRGLLPRGDEEQVAWADLDLDGRLDLVLSNRSNNEPLRVYRQVDEGQFELIKAGVLGDSDRDQQTSIALIDADNDGDEDLWVGKERGQATLYLNRVGDTRNALVLLLEDDTPRDATGARVTADTVSGTQRRDVVAASGHIDMEPSRRMVFGLGGASCAANVRVTWADGTEERVGRLEAGVYRWVRGDAPTQLDEM